VVRKLRRPQVQAKRWQRGGWQRKGTVRMNLISCERFPPPFPSHSFGRYVIHHILALLMLFPRTSEFHKSIAHHTSYGSSSRSSLHFILIRFTIHCNLRRYVVNSSSWRSSGMVKVQLSVEIQGRINFVTESERGGSILDSIDTGSGSRVRTK
jgi:hypothetical protein